MVMYSQKSFNNLTSVFRYKRKYIKRFSWHVLSIMEKKVPVSWDGVASNVIFSINGFFFPLASSIMERDVEMCPEIVNCESSSSRPPSCAREMQFHGVEID